jgi:hypothetical protein
MQLVDTVAEFPALLGPSFREQDMEKKLAMRKALLVRCADGFLFNPFSLTHSHSNTML